MPDIDPAALSSRADSLPNGSATPSGSIKPPPLSSGSAQKTGRPAQSAPRVDIEPLYTSLKSTIGDHWGTYKDCVSRFVLGFLSQDELYRQTEHFIAIEHSREHLHNQLVCAIHTNSHRDPPEAGVATWVSANDKPTTLSKPVTGDAAEHRLKQEVMQLPPRVRHRLKSIKDEPRQPLTHSIALSNSSRRLPPSSTTRLTSSDTNQTPLTASTNMSTSTSGLNKDQEIRRRYTQALISETRDIPSPSVLAERLLPICYEEGLSSGAANGAAAGELMADALDSFVKEALASILGPTRADAPLSDPASSIAGLAPTSGPGMPSLSDAAASLNVGAAASAPSIATAAYKARVEREGALAEKGALKRSEAGLLPAEIAAQRAHGQGRGMAGDVRIAWELGDPWLRLLTPWMGERLILQGWDGDDEGSSDGDADGKLDAMDGVVVQVNGHHPRDGISKDAAVNGIALIKAAPDELMTNGDMSMAIDDDDDDEDLGWEGAAVADLMQLDALLDTCLATAE